MTLQDVNKPEKDRAEAQRQRSPRRREPTDRLPKKSEADRRRLQAITELVQEAGTKPRLDSRTDARPTNTSRLAFITDDRPGDGTVRRTV